MDSQTSLDAVTGIIQSALAPVFLLVAIGGFLNVLSMRLGRIVDRKRVVDTELGQRVVDGGPSPRMAAETARLRRRSRLILWSIRLCVSGAVVVCVVVAALFVGGMTGAELGLIIAGLFMLAMLLITGGLICLLIEVGLAARQVGEAAG
jgi:hypothetical protein